MSSAVGLPARALDRSAKPPSTSGIAHTTALVGKDF